MKPYILESIRQNLGLKKYDTSEDEYINKLSPEQIVEKYLTWNGLIGWGYDIINLIEDVYKIKLKESDSKMPITSPEIEKLNSIDLLPFFTSNIDFDDVIYHIESEHGDVLDGISNSEFMEYVNERYKGVIEVYQKLYYEFKVKRSVTNNELERKNN